MLITKEVEVGLSGENIKRYESMGYEIPRRKGKWGYLSVKQGTKILVRVEDLNSFSKVRIEYLCDKCGTLNQTDYASYFIKPKNFGDCCIKCFNSVYVVPIANKTKFAYSQSFSDWCEENNEMDILERWDYDLNNENPEDVFSGSRKKYFFKCPIGEHESELYEISKIKHYGKSCNRCSSFGYKYPEMVHLWSDKNKESPMDISVHSHSKYYWKCDIHGDYKRTCSNSINCDFRCPKCTRDRDKSFLQEKVENYILKLGYSLLHESDCSISPINPKTNLPLRYDNEIPEISLLIEVHGTQHYIINSWHNHTNNPQKSLEYIQWKDQYKREYALSQGYSYLEIPYYTDDSSETYKQLIDDKIEEILSQQYYP